MRRIIAILVWIIATSTVAMAQTMNLDKHSFYIEFDKKVLYVDCMHLSNTTSVQRILNMLPEMLNRPGSTVFKSYDVRINGLSLGDAADGALMQLQLVDVEKIEVTESSASSYLNNGQGGSVNIVLRSKPYELPGIKHYNDSSRFWGSATLRGHYEPAVLPGLRLNWRNSKMLLHTIAMGSYWRYTSEKISTSKTNILNQASTTNYGTQFLGGYMNYNLTPKDILSVKVSERLSGKRAAFDVTSQDENAERTFSNAYDTARVFDVHALANYKHIFGKTTYMAEVQYLGTRESNGTYDGADNTWQRKNSSNFSGTTNITHNIFSNSNGNFGRLCAAFDFNLGWITDKWNDDGMMGLIPETNLKNSTVYLMPYLKWECRFGGFQMKAQAEYQYYKNTMREAENGDKNIDKDFTGMLVLEQSINENNHLRLMVSRKLQRPSYTQLCDWKRYMPDLRRYVLGDNELKSTHIHEISLDYITRFHWDTSALTIDVGANYYKVNDLIKQQRLLGLTPSGGGGATYKYVNMGEQDIFQGNFMVFCRVKNFSVALAANVYTSNIDQKDNNRYHTYYNISITPSFELPSGWDATLFAGYYSKVHDTFRDMGSCALTHLNVGRGFGPWHIHFYQRSVFTGKCEDTIFSSNGNTIKKYDIVNSEVGLGVRYLF